MINDDEKMFQQIQNDVWQLRVKISGYSVSNSFGLDSILGKLKEAENEAWKYEKNAQYWRERKEEEENKNQEVA